MRLKEIVKTVMGHITTLAASKVVGERIVDACEAKLIEHFQTGYPLEAALTDSFSRALSAIAVCVVEPKYIDKNSRLRSKINREAQDICFEAFLQQYSEAAGHSHDNLDELRDAVARACSILLDKTAEILPKGAFDEQHIARLIACPEELTERLLEKIDSVHSMEQSVREFMAADALLGYMVTFFFLEQVRRESRVAASLDANQGMDNLCEIRRMHERLETLDSKTEATLEATRGGNYLLNMASIELDILRSDVTSIADQLHMIGHQANEVVMISQPSGCGLVPSVLACPGSICQRLGAVRSGGGSLRGAHWWQQRACSRSASAS